MLEHHEFCDHCPGCRPAMINFNTGQPAPADSPMMIAVNRVWNTQTTYAERKAFIEVTVHNSRDAHDMALASAVVQKFEAALKGPS